MANLAKLDKWHKTRQGYFVSGLVELALAYGVASWAIDNGSLLLYLICIVLLVGGLHNLAKFVKALVHGKSVKTSKS